MPWQLEQRDGKYCVVKKGESSPVPGGCHATRADAIKHQRALYANESRMASIYNELDEQTETYVEPVTEDKTSLVAMELISMIARSAEEKAALAASVQAREEQQRAEAQEERQALVAALGRLGSPVINLPPAEVNVNVPPAEVNFTAPAPEVVVNVPPAEVNFMAPPAEVNVTVEAPPPVQKTVTFERDPLTQQVTRAEVTET